MQFKMAFNTALVEYYLDLNNLLQACDRSILTNFGSLNTNMTLRNVHNDVVVIINDEGRHPKVSK